MKNQRQNRSIRHDLSLLFLLMWAFAQAVIIALAAQSTVQEYLLLFFCADIAVLLCFFGHRSIGLTLSGLVTCAFVAWKLYAYFRLSAPLAVLDDLLIPLPILGAAAASVYSSADDQAIDVSEHSHAADEPTGLPQLSTLYSDMSLLSPLCLRNRLPLTLLLIQLRYDEEVQHMLSSEQYEETIRQLAQTVCANVRKGDRVYRVDSQSTLAVLLVGASDECAAVRSQIAQAAVGATYAVDGYESYMGLRFGAMEYHERFGEDMVQFKKAAESELVYDV